MNDLESRLRELSVREPPATMDERVLGERPTPAVSSARAGIRVSIRWAVAACLLVAFAAAWAGYTAGAGRGAQIPAAAADPPPVQIQVIYNSPSAQNPFDFTTATEDEQTDTWGGRVETVHYEEI